MGKHYSYRIDHDVGFAPNPYNEVCTLSGCKTRKKDGTRNIENLAQKDNWIIGIGGNNTGKPDKLIYAMKVKENISYDEFFKKYPEKSKYLSRKKAGERVLVSKDFYYLGDKAINLPDRLSHLITNTQGYKTKSISDEDIKLLEKHLHNKGFEGYGKYGEPNNKNEEKQSNCNGCQTTKGC